jgi:hypothetical protein
MRALRFKKQDTDKPETHLSTTTNTNRVRIIFKTLLLSAVVVSAIAVTFIHEYLPHVSQEYQAHKKKYAPIIKKRNDSFENLLIQLGDKTITTEEFIIKYKEVKVTASRELKQFNKTKKEILAKNSYMGFNSIKNFWFTICFPICGLVLAFLFLNIIINPVQQKHLKKFYLVFSFAFIACWSYWLIWSLISIPGNPDRPFDFPKLYYDIALYILPIILFTGAYYLMKYYTSIEQKLKKILRPFFDFFYRDAEERNLIRPEKKVEFDKITIELTDHVVTNE